MLADFASLKQVKRLGETILQRYPAIHRLINNAGMANLKYHESEDHLEMVFAVNHLAPFLLTNTVLPALKNAQDCRIINVSSNAHRMGVIDFGDIGYKDNYTWKRAYGQSKLANILFTKELAKRLESSATVNCMHPGVVRTNIGANNNPLLQKILMFLIAPFARSPKKGAETIFFLATDPVGGQVSGRYFIDCAEKRPSTQANRQDLAEKLWVFSERLIDKALAHSNS
mgnify:CR=1 FL=1